MFYVRNHHKAVSVHQIKVPFAKLADAISFAVSYIAQHEYVAIDIYNESGWLAWSDHSRLDEDLVTYLSSYDTRTLLDEPTPANCVRIRAYVLSESEKAALDMLRLHDQHALIKSMFKDTQVYTHVDVYSPPPDEDLLFRVTL